MPGLSTRTSAGRTRGSDTAGAPQSCSPGRSSARLRPVRVSGTGAAPVCSAPAKKINGRGAGLAATGSAKTRHGQSPRGRRGTFTPAAGFEWQDAEVSLPAPENERGLGLDVLLGGEPGHAVVSLVVPGGVAEAAGLRPGDRLLEIGGTRVSELLKTDAGADEALRRLRAGPTKVKIEYAVRAGHGGTALKPRAQQMRVPALCYSRPAIYPDLYGRDYVFNNWSNGFAAPETGLVTAARWSRRLWALSGPPRPYFNEWYFGDDPAYFAHPVDSRPWARYVHAW